MNVREQVRLIDKVVKCKQKFKYEIYLISTQRNKL